MEHHTRIKGHRLCVLWVAVKKPSQEQRSLFGVLKINERVNCNQACAVADLKLSNKKFRKRCDCIAMIFPQR